MNRAQGHAVTRRLDLAEVGMSLLEVLIVVAIIATLVAIIIPRIQRALTKANLTRTMADMRTIEKILAVYEIEHDELPDSLGPVIPPTVLDGWGRPFQYLKIRGAAKPPRGKWRKDRFLVPINSDFDLYSMGPDGVSRPPLTARMSRDDIVRAADGAFLGWASDY